MLQGPTRVRGAPPLVRGETAQLEIPIRQVKHVELTGRDTASGKSWQTWMKKQEAAQAAATEAAANA